MEWDRTGTGMEQELERRERREMEQRGKRKQDGGKLESDIWREWGVEWI